MRAAAIQLNANGDTDRNLRTADRLVRRAASAGAELVALPEKWTVLGTREDMAAGAETLDGRAISWARETAAELGIDLVAGSIFERVEGRELGANTSVHIGPDGELKAVYRKIHLFDVEIDGARYAESATEAPGDQIVVSRAARRDQARSQRLLRPAIPGAVPDPDPGGRARSSPCRPRSRYPTTRDHWETLIRARAIENQCFVIAANQIGHHPGNLRSGGRSMIVDPWGVVLAQATDRETAIVADLELDSIDEVRDRMPALAHRRPTAYDWGADVTTAATDKRRVILDAAVRVFARQGFHTCRVSDIADEAGVAYGLVYHYFSSKEEILDTLFLERWDVMLAAIAEADASDRSPREKLYAIAAFIIDSYRHDPELMKVIIVEVTRAANTFGLTHLDKIREAYAGIAAIVAHAQADGSFRPEVTPEFAALAFYGSSSRF